MERKHLYDFLILDPASTEFNRGSFCYQPYILYNALKSQGHDVYLWENFTIADIDNLPNAKHTSIALWSYPQIETCLVLDRFLESRYSFFGYHPLIKKYNLPIDEMPDELILEGMRTYPRHYKDFKYLLLSDCDMHLKKYDGIVYPMFTSYGCPRNCSFCPSSVNCGRTRLELPEYQVVAMLNECYELGIKNIHFTDEDFFYDVNRARNILDRVKKKDFNFIALGSVAKVQHFIDVYGEDILEEGGMRIIEVGFETGDDNLSKSMNKPSLNTYKRLASQCTKVDIFWLTLTFFPGETIKTLNNTGEFLAEYGMSLEEVYGRIATNSTQGGLGQFFQLYDGVKDYETLHEEGEVQTSRPMRLIPSFIPYSFMNSEIKSFRPIEQDEVKWFNLYKINPFDRTIKLGKLHKNANSVEDYIFYAICARLGVIR